MLDKKEIANLRELYYAPGGFQPLDELLRDYKDKYNADLDAGDVKQWLSGQYVNQINKRPGLKAYGANTRFNVEVPNRAQAVDIMEIVPDSKTRAKYILNIVDLASRYKESRALTKKSAESVLAALKDIYAHSPLKPPETLLCDSGSEFKGVVGEFYEKAGTMIRRAETNYHKSQGHVEIYNAILAKVLFKHMTADGIEKGRVSNEWQKYLKGSVDSLNRRVHSRIKMAPIDAIKLKIVPQKLYSKSDIAAINKNKFEMGDAVRYLLQRDDAEFGLRRRATDPTYSTGVYYVNRIIDSKINPILYFISNEYKQLKHGFTGAQLQKTEVPTDE
jgi:hypothetical protein